MVSSCVFLTFFDLECEMMAVLTTLFRKNEFLIHYSVKIYEFFCYHSDFYVKSTLSFGHSLELEAIKSLFFAEFTSNKIFKTTKLISHKKFQSWPKNPSIFTLRYIILVKLSNKIFNF